MSAVVDKKEFEAVGDGYDSADTRKRVKAILVGSVGNLIEWYDIYAYAAFALYFADSFFPKADPVVQQLNAAVLFALAFLMRPLGGFLFGYIADRYGRRQSLMASVLLMCFGSLLIAVAPTYSQIGVWATVILILARLLQGLSVGGEYGTSTTYLAEVAHPNRRGFYSGVWYTTLVGGQLCAILVLLVLQKFFLSVEELKAWGWRIPFIIGALVSVFALYMRRGMPETEHFKEAQKLAKSTEHPFRTMFRHWRQLLMVIGITVGGTSAFYTYTTYMQKFLKLSVKLTDDQTTMVVTGSLIFAIILQPLYGWMSDIVGRKPMLVGFGILGTLLTYPLLTAIQNTQSPFVAFLLICGAWAIVSGYTSITAIVKAELFPTNIRALGIGVPYALTVSMVGGTVDSVGLYFKSIGHENWFFWYATGLIFISLLVYLNLKDTKKHSRMEDHT